MELLDISIHQLVLWAASYSIQLHKCYCCRVYCVYCVSMCTQAVVLEGKYWKRKVEAVATEYRKWRLYYKEKNVG